MSKDVGQSLKSVVRESLMKRYSSSSGRSFWLGIAQASKMSVKTRPSSNSIRFRKTDMFENSNKSTTAEEMKEKFPPLHQYYN